MAQVNAITLSQFTIFLLLLAYVHGGPKVGLNFLHSGIDSNYFVSDAFADAITAEETCKSNGKSLLSVETEEEFNNIQEHLIKSIGVDGVWTSGMETVFEGSRERDYLWTSTALPLAYTNFANPLGNLLTGLHRLRRGIHGYYPGDNCNCNNEPVCNERPVCQNVNCTISGETCSIEQPTCSNPTHQDCYLIEPASVCSVTCPECVLKRGSCTLIQPVCKIKPGTGNCTTSRKGHCTVIPATYEVRPGKCKLIQEPCAVVQPSEPCHRPINCTYQYKPSNDPACGGFGKDAPSIDEKLESENYTTRNCTISCPPGQHCPHPCPEDSCHRIFNCVPDLICQAPPVICPPPIHHCFPAEVVKISDEALDCDEPETICDPPIVDCTEVQKKCEEDVITCPPPQTVCTPAVSHCPRPEYTCSKPTVECGDPTVSCPDLPSCTIPIECYGGQGYPVGPGNCNCRGKREITDKGALVSAKCISLKKSLSFKWTLEECYTKNYFICEEPRLP